jgi:hypothetical protein
MPHDPNEHFDHVVLDMIEHSPVGAVPATPAYQDALGRLYAAHQVYAAADHKDGHVTARSLAGIPSFHAANLDAFFAGGIGAHELEGNAAVFDRYVHSLPAERRARAEGYRMTVAGRPAMHRAKHAGGEKLPSAHDLAHALFLVPGAGPHPGLPGNYLYGFVLEASPGDAHGAWSVHLHDRDDGAALFHAATLAEAASKLQDVLGSAPFKMDELEGLGFHLA